MKPNSVIKMVMTVAIVALLGFGAQAFAQSQATGGFPPAGAWNDHMGYSHGHGRWDKCHRWDQGHRWDRGHRWAENLSAADRQKLIQSQIAFFKDTAQLRQEMFQKRLALAAEMAKINPDPAVLSKIQGELSTLKGQFAQKRIMHVLEMKKIVPDIGMNLIMGKGFGFSGRGCWR